MIVVRPSSEIALGQNEGCFLHLADVHLRADGLLSETVFKQNVSEIPIVLKAKLFVSAFPHSVSLRKRRERPATQTRTKSRCLASPPLCQAELNPSKPRLFPTNPEHYTLFGHENYWRLSRYGHFLRAGVKDLYYRPAFMQVWIDRLP